MALTGSLATAAPAGASDMVRTRQSASRLMPRVHPPRQPGSRAHARRRRCRCVCGMSSVNDLVLVQGMARHQAGPAALERPPLADAAPLGDAQPGDRRRAAGGGLRGRQADHARPHRLPDPGLQLARRRSTTTWPCSTATRSCSPCTRWPASPASWRAARCRSSASQAQRPLALGAREGGPARDRLRGLRDHVLALHAGLRDRRRRVDDRRAARHQPRHAAAGAGAARAARAVRAVPPARGLDRREPRRASGRTCWPRRS